jgi:hypothetical protein
MLFGQYPLTPAKTRSFSLTVNLYLLALVHSIARRCRFGTVCTLGVLCLPDGFSSL